MSKIESWFDSLSLLRARDPNFNKLAEWLKSLHNKTTSEKILRQTTIAFIIEM